MKINKICNKLGLKNVKFNHEVLYITDDSRDVIGNSIFFAIKGNTVDGNKKIDEAINNGAATIVLNKKINEREGINYIYTNNVKRLLALFLCTYYHKVLKNLKIIGVIGTNGKTTTSTLIHKYLQFSKKRSLLIGSNGALSDNFYHKNINTTPKATELYTYFNYAYQNSIEYIVMEVSSISVSELRVFDIPFNVLVFTNFYEDHLDYHKTIDNYFYNKAIPFYKLTCKDYAIINLDDAKACELIKHLNSKIITYSINNNSQIQAKNICISDNGIEFTVNNFIVKSNLIGEFNTYNILPLFAISKIYNLNYFKILLFLRNFKQVDGRMNLINIGSKQIIIDYAHTESAVKNACMEAKRLNKGKLYVILGCGGNRQKDKRYKIGKILDNIDCEVILTSDNPRFEKPMDIINDIKSGINRDVKIIENRRDAIIFGLNNLDSNDTLLILGKGVEDYIEINGHFEEYSDYKVIEEYKGDIL